MTNTLSTNSNKELSSDFDVRRSTLSIFVESPQYVSKCQLHLSFSSPFHGDRFFFLYLFIYFVRTLFTYSFLFCILSLSSTFISNESLFCNCFHLKRKDRGLYFFYLNFIFFFFICVFILMLFFI